MKLTSFLSLLIKLGNHSLILSSLQRTVFMTNNPIIVKCKIIITHLRIIINQLMHASTYR